METDRKWIVVRVNGKLAGISRDYGRLADISTRIAQEYRISETPQDVPGKRPRRKKNVAQGSMLPYSEITATAATFEEILEIKKTIQWEGLLLFGTDFQKRVWKTLWDLYAQKRLLSYSDFAELCKNKAGVRAVAHAIGLNPLPIIIPCHLVVPKEAIDRILEIKQKAEATIFKGEDLCQTSILNDNATDFGEYALGKQLKRKLISLEIAGEIE